jgi:hypothetical protein
MLNIHTVFIATALSFLLSGFLLSAFVLRKTLALRLRALLR